MVDHSNRNPEVCVVGRSRFDTGIGAFVHAACELFSRHVPTCIIPTDRAPDDLSPVVLPSGRVLPVCADPLGPTVFFYADILFNGAGDDTLSRMPANGVHIAHFCFDSDELPLEWVTALNQRFDLAYVPTPSQRDLAVHSGVRIPVGVLPIGLPIEPLLARRYRPAGDVVRFGTITAFHERKELTTLVQAFQAAFVGRTDVELVIHSNLAFGAVYAEVVELAASTSSPRVIVSHDSLTDAARNDLLNSFDVFVNCSRGEGFSIGAREALALGKTLVLSDIGVHRDIGHLPGVFYVETDRWVPARYAEIDHRVIGRQRCVDPLALQSALSAASEFVASPDATATQGSRRRRAAQYSFTDLSIEYAVVVDLEAPAGRIGSAARRSPDVVHPDQSHLTQLTSWRHQRRRQGWTNRLVVPAHDGGFYSVFNSYVSHLAWSLQDDRCHMVLPDWDQTRMSERLGTDERESFCYGKFSDGNIWTRLFDPVFGCSDDELDDREFLYGRAVRPDFAFNEQLEPLLTYSNAFDLYHSPTFPRFRRQYHAALQAHVRLRPELQAEIDEFTQEHVAGRRLLAAHVKHPSHVVEQPTALMAAQAAYFGYVDRYLAEQDIPVSSDDWRIFIGTDQEAVIADFRDRYGHHVICHPEARRTTAEEDRVYQEVARENPAVVGYQVQHLVAASPDNWSVDMARDILRDSFTMAQAELLLHIVSNVSTAVSYLNPDLRMQFVAAPAG